MPDAQYVVDVAAQMSGGAQTVAQLDALASTLMAAGVSADNLQDAVALASNALAAAKTSSADANAALAAGATEFANLEQAALQAGKAQEKAAKMGVVPPEVAAALQAANSALAQQTDILRGLEGAAAAAGQNENQLAQTLANVKVAATAGAKALADEANAAKAASAAAVTAAKAEEAELAKKAKAAETAQAEQAAATKKSVREAEGFSPIVKKFNDLGDAMSTSEGQATLLAGAITGTVAALAAVAVAVAIATIAFVSYAVGLADANQNTALVTDATEILHPELEALRDTIDGLTDSTGLSETALDQIAISLKAAHVAAKDLPAALKAAADAEAVLGQGGAQEFIAQMKASGQSVEAFSAKVDSELAGDVAAKLKGLDAQSAKLHKEMGSLFGGLDIEPVLNGMQTLVGLFDENTAAGSAMKLLFEAVFQPLIDQAENAAEVIEGFVLGFLIGLTKVYIALKPAIAAVTEFFGFDDTGLADVCDIAAKAGEAAAYIFVGFVAVLAAVGAAIGFLIAQVLAVSAVIAALVVGVIAAGAAIIDGIVGAFTAVKDYLSNLSLAQIGSDMIQGLINGLLNAGPAVLNAITGIADGAIKAAKHALGIASPSTEFAAIGGYTGEGFVDGVTAMTGEAQDAMATMVEPPDAGSPAIAGNFGASATAGASSASPARGASSGGGGSLLGSNNQFIFNGVADAEQAEKRFEEMLLRVVEGHASALVPTGAPQ